MTTTPKFALTFRPADQALKILSVKDGNNGKEAILAALHDEHLVIRGDVVEMLWFQGFTNHLQPGNWAAWPDRAAEPGGSQAQDGQALFVRIKPTQGGSRRCGARMDRLEAMQAFARVVEAGSFTKAAETLHMNKTTVTQQIQYLEARLRVKLLNRTTRQVNLTADGAAYYERVVRILVDIEESETVLSSSAAAPRGRLRVDVLGVIGRHMLLPAMPQFHARYPDIQIDLGLSDRAVDLIGDNVDCVVRAGEVADQSLVARRIGTVGYVMCASVAYLERLGRPSKPSELADSAHRVVAYFSARTGKVFPYAMRRAGETVQVDARYVVAVNDAGALLDAGLTGLGIIRLPRFMADPHLASGELVAVLQDWQTEPTSIYVAFPPNRHVSAKLRVFVDWVAETVALHAPLPPPATPLQRGG